jgi:hypothetical protein
LRTSIVAGAVGYRLNNVVLCQSLILGLWTCRVGIAHHRIMVGNAHPTDVGQPEPLDLTKH